MYVQPQRRDRAFASSGIGLVDEEISAGIWEVPHLWEPVQGIHKTLENRYLHEHTSSDKSQSLISHVAVTDISMKFENTII